MRYEKLVSNAKNNRPLCDLHNTTLLFFADFYVLFYVRVACAYDMGYSTFEVKLILRKSNVSSISIHVVLTASLA